MSVSGFNSEKQGMVGRHYHFILLKHFIQILHFSLHFHQFFSILYYIFLKIHNKMLKSLGKKPRYGRKPEIDIYIGVSFGLMTW